MNPKILITIDVEDWFQVENLRSWVPPRTWRQQQLRVERNTHKILDLFDSITLKQTPSNTIKTVNTTKQTHPKATFFILGWIAKRCPNLTKEIAIRGHEVASHGNNHLMCNQLDHNDLKKDLLQSKKILEGITGNKVNGYRAPNFSINETVLELVQRCGYKYDSSYNNFCRHGRYGKISLSEYKKVGVAIKISNKFIELPISNLTFRNQIIPWGGGGYFRFLPLPIFKAGIKSILNKSDAYIFYLHPWEIDPLQPRIKEAKGLSSWRHYLNLKKTYPRLHNLITTFKNHQFLTCSQYIDDIDPSIQKAS